MSRLRLVFLSLLTVIVVSAAASASASATEFFHKGGTAISGVLSVETLGGTQTLTGTAGGVTVEIECKKVEGHGTIENVGGMGLGLGLILYLFCVVIRPAGGGCLVLGGIIHVPHVHILTTGTSIVPLVQFSPALGAAFVVITFHGCTGGFIGLNKSFNVTGTAVASANNSTGELEFKTGAPNNKLIFAGEEATYVGNDKMLMVGGGEIEVK